jgi:hypothetical protein
MPNHYGTKKKIPSKNKKGSVPPDYDVILPGMGYTKPTATKQPTKIKPKARPTARPTAPKGSPGGRTPNPKPRITARPSRIKPNTKKK